MIKITLLSVTLILVPIDETKFKIVKDGIQIVIQDTIDIYKTRLITLRKIIIKSITIINALLTTFNAILSKQRKESSHKNQIIKRFRNSKNSILGIREK